MDNTILPVCNCIGFLPSLCPDPPKSSFSGTFWPEPGCTGLLSMSCPDSPEISFSGSLLTLCFVLLEVRVSGRELVLSTPLGFITCCLRTLLRRSGLSRFSLVSVPPSAGSSIVVRFPPLLCCSNSKMNKNQDVAFNLGVKKLWAHYANTNRSMTPMHIPKQTISISTRTCAFS